MTTTPTRRLRWYQYSLRSLFVLTVLVAVAGSWFAVKRQQVERERAAVRAIVELGGAVSYDTSWRDIASEFNVVEEKRPGPAWLRAWLGEDFFAHVKVVFLPDTRTADAAIEHLRGLSQLELLMLLNSKVTDEDVKKLQEALPNCNVIRYLDDLSPDELGPTSRDDVACA